MSDPHDLENLNQSSIDFEKLRREITRDNALDLLADVACPYCSGIGQYQLFDEIGNNGVGIRCFLCDKHHPFIKQHILWLRSADRRPSNDIVAVIKACGNYCYFCGGDFPALRERGIAPNVHHTRRFAEHGERYAKIPVCGECHELATFMQRLRQRQWRFRR